MRDAHGDHFTAGLDLAQVAGRIAEGRPRYDSETAVDPWGLIGRERDALARPARFTGR